MNSPPSFFVAKVAPEKQEECYVELARAIGRAAPTAGSRIYSITFTHNGERWTATVGEQLRGSATRTSRVRGQKVERMVPLSNGSTVMAIFPSVPFHVWHDGASGAWANPFLTSEPTSITYFPA
ncbi:hypothetical protein [Sphingomonas montana]|uniref:hypothetical protein n=1 Tax=Sphingomonas montana TaxID=1843236 RepID=UPI00096F6795|nr:hypothetical protein [Sphingomonas montana]